MSALLPASSARILTWNLQWKPPSGRAGRLIRDVLREAYPDVAVLTETHGLYLDGGHVVEAGPEWGYGESGVRRKVSVWSREPWTDIDAVGGPAFPPGRFVRAVTATPVGPVEVIGVCIPWFGANVRDGRKDRVRWEDHRAYLEALGEYLARGRHDRTVIAGDFNQRVPRRRQPVEMYDLLRTVLEGVAELATAGDVLGLDAPVIDHVAVGSGLISKGAVGIPALHPTGERMSDHAGVVVELGWEGISEWLSEAELRRLRADKVRTIAFARRALGSPQGTDPSADEG